MDAYEEFRDDSPKEVPVHGFLHRSPGMNDDWLVLTHGAGRTATRRCWLRRKTASALPDGQSSAAITERKPFHPGLDGTAWSVSAWISGSRW